MSVTDRADTVDGVRLRHRPLPHQLAAWWGFVGAVVFVAVRLGPWWGGFPGSAVAGGMLFLHAALAAGVPAVGAWLAAHPANARAQAGLVMLATWGVLAVPVLPHVIELLTQQPPINLFSVVAFHGGTLIPLVGLALAGWALARGEGLAWRYPASWRRRLAGLGVAVYGFAAVLPPTVSGPTAGLGGGYWEQLLVDPWGLAGKVLMLVLVAALGVAVARLDVALALGPAVIVAVHAVARVTEFLVDLVDPSALGVPGPAAAVATVHLALTVHIIAALAAVAATAWLATRVRLRTIP